MEDSTTKVVEKKGSATGAAVMKGLDTFLAVIGSCALIATIGCITLNVAMRMLFRQSPAWAEEYGYLFFCYAVYIGAAICYKRGELISINVFVLMLPKAAQRVIFYFNRILMVFVNIYLFYLSIEFTVNAAKKMTPLMRIPYSYIDASIAIMFAIIVFFSFRDVIRAVLKLDVMETERRAE